MLTDSQRHRVFVAMGTLAHNRSFTARDMQDYVGFSAREFLRKLVKTGLLEIVSTAPIEYYPTAAGWDRIEAEIK